MVSDSEDLMNEGIIEWKAPSFRFVERPLKWYLIMGAVVLGFVIYGLLTQDYMISITFLIFAAVYYWLSCQKPKMVPVVISDIGIKFGKHFFSYGSIEQFWMYYDPPHLQSLNLSLRKKVFSIVTIEYPGNLSPAVLRDVLSKHLPEAKGREESMTEGLIRNLGL